MAATRELEDVMSFLAGAMRRRDPVGDDRTLAEAARLHVTGNSRLTPDQQVDIYRRQFWLRHIDSLVEDYPGLVALLGDEGFDAFARAYLDAHPPSHASLRDLGHAIVGFGAAHGLGGAALDMLRYEHLFIDLFDAAEPAPLDVAKLAAVAEDAWARTRIVLSPLLALARLDYPVHEARLALKDGGACVAPPRAAAPIRVVLYRMDGMIRFEEVDAQPFELLERLARGEALTAACEAIAAPLSAPDREVFEARAGAWFQGWTARRFIVDVESDAKVGGSK